MKQELIIDFLFCRQHGNRLYFSLVRQQTFFIIDFFPFSPDEIFSFRQKAILKNFVLTILITFLYFDETCFYLFGQKTRLLISLW